MDVDRVVFAGQRLQLRLRHALSRPHLVHVMFPAATQRKRQYGAQRSSQDVSERLTCEPGAAPLLKLLWAETQKHKNTMSLFFIKH